MVFFYKCMIYIMNYMIKSFDVICYNLQVNLVLERRDICRGQNQTTFSVFEIPSYPRKSAVSWSLRYSFSPYHYSLAPFSMSFPNSRTDVYIYSYILILRIIRRMNLKSMAEFPAKKNTNSKTRINSFTTKCSSLGKQHRARLYILRRCVTMLLRSYIDQDD